MNRSVATILLLVGTGIVGLVLSVLWGRMTRPDSFDRDTVVFLAKMFGSISVGGVIVFLILKYKLL
jgi:hypothetical protein